MSFLTKARIRAYSNQRLSQKSFPDYLRSNVYAPGKSRVFLSHSHLDVQDLSNEDIRALIVLLMEFADDIYIDWLDPEMPDEPCEETAKRLQEKINDCDRFLLVATTNAISSRWVPWELGYADNAKGVNNISVIPIADPDGRWEGAEYMRLYPRLLLTVEDRPAVFAPSVEKGYRLGYWVSTGQLFHQ